MVTGWMDLLRDALMEEGACEAMTPARCDRMKAMALHLPKGHLALCTHGRPLGDNPVEEGPGSHHRS